LAAAEDAHWTSSRIHGSPLPPKAYVAEQVFTKVPLNNALDMVPVPGLAQWLFVENGGKIWVTPNDLNTSQADVAIDLKTLHPALDHAYGVAFHPKFKENKEVFITYTNGDKLDDGSRLSRFKVKQDTPLVIDPASEEVLITWLSGGHNGAAITFGNDGLLYLSTGDAEVPAPPDPRKTGQDITDLLSSVLRIDVDHKDAGKAYAVPKDNPFVSTPNARPEIWCYGLRNPWKMSFDRPTGRLWCGDVGWELWENVYLIKRGENYGWSATEGNNPILMERKGPTPITPPIVTHPHSEAASITGGFVYHGERLQGLDGAYLYADYETGKIWSLRYDGSKVTKHDEIADTPLKIVTFGQDEEGDVFFIHYGPQSTVHRLVKNPAIGQPSDFPRKLSETGVFADVVKQTPAKGVHGFNIRAPMWADGAQASRFIALPTGKVETSIRTTKQGKIESKVTWPAEAVLAKTVTMPLDQDKPDSAIKVETQVLHFDGVAWNAYSYRWNDAGTDAELVPPTGGERTLELHGNAFPSGTHRYSYRFHSQAECLRCHTSWTGVALSFQPPQLTDAAPFIAAGLIDENYLKQSEARLVDPYDARAELHQRARSWLHANCAHCHRQNGGGAVPMMLNAELALDEMKAIHERPTRGDFGIGTAEVLSPGSPWHSAAVHRIATLGANHMPMIGAQTVDVKGLMLLQRWLLDFKEGDKASTPSLAGYPLSVMRSTTSPTGWMEDATEWFAMRSRNPRVLDQLMADVPGAAFMAYAIDTAVVAGEDRARAIKLATASPNAHIRGLFERFLADSERSETLGAAISVEKITAMAGDADRGSALLSSTGKAGACLACHLIGKAGRDVGPDLTHVGSRLTSTQILEAILTPSKTLTQGYQAITAKLKDGTSQVGFVVKREGDVFALKTATGDVLNLPRDQVFSEIPLPVSLMPEGQLQAFTAQEAADLVSYLSALR
jgi:putative heme-binding domain-containing protein